MNIQQIIQRIGQQINAQKGNEFAQGLLACDNTTFQSQLQDLSLISRLCIQSLVKPYDNIVTLYLKSLHYNFQNNIVQAFMTQRECVDALYQQMESERDSNWSLPAINIILRYLRTLSCTLDTLQMKAGEKTKYMTETQDILKTFLQKMVNDRAASNVSKKQGCLFIIVHLFKIYFRLNNLRLCTYLIRMIPQLPPLHTFPLAQQVAYQYYIGRLHIFDEKYDEAEQALSFAFQKCLASATRNKRRILQFLIPVKLLKSTYPHTKLLQTYDLLQFQQLIDAIRNGELNEFNQALDTHHSFFVKKGIFLILEKLKTFVYRNLFRKVHAYHMNASTDAAQKHLLPLDTLLAALRINHITMGVDELECILANLIYAGNIRGYIAHKRCVVLSKQEPFPKMT